MPSPAQPAAPAPRRFEIVRTVAALRAAVAGWRAAGERVGFIPTMGALHAGHVSLLRESQRLCQRHVVSIFVNPTQFSPNEDFAAYPRDEGHDADLLRQSGADLLFAPAVAEMYPAGFRTRVTVDGLTQYLCGASRPGHFAGVATVVTKLLLQGLPDVAFFGEKDFQQLQVIRRLVRDLDIPVAITGVATMREADGLALSSRNRFLSPAERQTAARFPVRLRLAAAQLAQGADIARTLADLRAALAVDGITAVDYLALCDEETLTPIMDKQEGRSLSGTRLFAAIHIGRTRLIDNWKVA